MSEPAKRYYKTFSDNMHLQSENARLKAEVEELRLENQAFQRTVNEASAHYDNRLEENARLKTELERLTKAGDAMAFSIQFNEEMAQDYNGPTIVHQSVKRWRAAKEGKGQS